MKQITNLLYLIVLSCQCPLICGASAKSIEAIEIECLFEKYAGIALIKQLTLADKISNQAWSINLPKQRIRFHNGLTTKIQLIGTKSLQSNTWLWAWANTSIAGSKELISESLKLKKYGIQQNIIFLTKPQIKLDTISANKIIFIASGLLNIGSYYRTSYTGGVAYYYLPDYPKNQELNKSAARLVRTISQLTNSFKLNHRFTIKHMIDKLALTYSEKKQSITININTQFSLLLTFNSKQDLSLMKLMQIERKIKDIH